jgi:Fe/S biogenesis protein NfuA
MRIMDKLFRAGKRSGAPSGDVALREGVPIGMIQENAVLTVTEEAKEKIRSVLDSQQAAVRTIRVSAAGPGKYSMSLETEGQPRQADVVLPYDGFEVYIDPQSLPLVEGATLKWVDTYSGGGFQFDNPNEAAAGPQPGTKKQPPEGPEGAIWKQIEEILRDEVNPAVAGHGGFIDLIEYKDGTAYVLMGGGCQGCGMANVTLKSGVERILKSQIPEVQEILDVTDHAGGRNPYYAPSSK